MEAEKDWDEEMGWDRNYAKKALICDIETVKDHMPRLLRGRTTESIIEDVRKNGTAKSLNSLRDTVFTGIGIKREENVSAPVNIIKIGCNGFVTISILRNYCLLLQELGIEYGFLSKEYCCLAPALYGVLMRGHDRTLVDESARKMMSGNVAQAKVLGAGNMVNFCLYCYWRAKWLLGDSDMPQLYAFDILNSPELWEGKSMRLDQKVGYLSIAGGTAERRLRVYIPEYVQENIFSLPWQDYRGLLDRIDGLHVVDIINENYPQFDELLWKQLRENNLDTLVVNHPHEYSLLRHAAKKESPRTKIVFLSDILLQSLGVTPWMN
ncbi:MAG: hypothetical protein JW882_10445 [Deltaproteobacteria bacterium]|nr:hypothetical protein [Deltaproteobacteria bacterium]